LRGLDLGLLLGLLRLLERRLDDVGEIIEAGLHRRELRHLLGEAGEIRRLPFELLVLGEILLDLLARRVDALLHPAPSVLQHQPIRGEQVDHIRDLLVGVRPARRHLGQEVAVAHNEHRGLFCIEPIGQRGAIMLERLWRALRLIGREQVDHVRGVVLCHGHDAPMNNDTPLVMGK
jgi:hypothetical protein